MNPALSTQALTTQALDVQALASGATANAERVLEHGTGGPPGGVRLELVSPGTGEVLVIDGAGAMPPITPQVRVRGIDPDPTDTMEFTWTVSVSCDLTQCLNGANAHQPYITSTFTATTIGGTLNMAFPWVRGGDLAISVMTTIEGTTLLALSEGLKIVGTNPPRAALHQALPHDTLRRIAHQESEGKQFDAKPFGGTSACPNLGEGGDTGVMQLASPPPTDEQVWSWRANVQAAVALFGKKLVEARAYPSLVRDSERFRELVTQFNANREQQGKAPIDVTLPDFSSSGFDASPADLGQLELDTIRGYNGWAGRDQFGAKLHEFRVKCDGEGQLIVAVNPAGTTGQAGWERVPAEDRPQGPKVGDPNYVNRVLARAPL